MTTVFSFQCPSQIGEIAKFTKCLADENINITGMSYSTNNGQDWIWFCTNNSQQTANCLKNNGYKYTKSNGTPVRFKDQPGTCYEYCNELANQNVNINAFFVTTDGHEVFETNNPSKAQEVAQNLGVYHEPAYA